MSTTEDFLRNDNLTSVEDILKLKGVKRRKEIIRNWVFMSDEQCEFWGGCADNYATMITGDNYGGLEEFTKKHCEHISSKEIKKAIYYYFSWS